MDLRGQRTLLTGATGGLGGTIARALAARGAKLVLTGRRLDVLEPLAEELGAEAIASDLSDRAEPARLAAAAGAIDVFVSNAGLPGSGPISEYTEDQIDRALDVNLRAPMLLTHALMPGMVERDRGHVVFVSSLVAKVTTPGSAIYAATKVGLRAFSLALRQDLHGTGVSSSVVFPTMVKDAGMFAETGAALPRWAPALPGPGDVAGAVVKAIERGRAEVDVAPLSMRAAGLAAGVAPETVSRLNRLIPVGDVADEIVAAQRSKR
jgi:short-subunit dehydrogenase